MHQHVLLRVFYTLEEAKLSHLTECKAIIILSPVENYKYLGVTIQSDLKWHKHIQSVTCKASQTLGLLKLNLQASQWEKELT